jgi:polygalacturonase
MSIFNVKDYGATGVKADNAQAAIQKAIDACGKAGGGMVYLPPGEYTSGTLYLLSHVRLHIEGGATLYASKDMKPFTGQAIASKAALLFAENVEDVTPEGRVTVNGQSAYEWKIDE